MKRKKLNFDNDLDFAKTHVLIVSTIANIKLTPKEQLCLAGLVVLSKDSPNILSPKSKRLLSELIGLNGPNIRSLTDRLISKKIILKRDRSEGFIIGLYTSELKNESYEIHLERVSK
jgi:hypothetical protein